MLGYVAGIVDVVNRTAAAGLGCVGDAVLAGQARLVPELKRQAHHRMLSVGEQGRNRRGVYPSGHGYGDGCLLGHG